MLAGPGSLLRAEGRYAVGRVPVPWARLLGIVVVCGAAYGLVMGTLPGRGARPTGERELAALYAALKVPILLTGATFVCLPNFFVVNALFGLRGDFAAATRGILSAQGTVAVCLLSLAPVTAVVYVSGASYPVALAWNACAFALAALGGQRTLARHYRPLVARRPRHRQAVGAWLVLYVFVSIKLAWILRPFVGDPALPVEFLRAEKWQENPYVNLFWTAAWLVGSLLRRLVGA